MQLTWGKLERDIGVREHRTRKKGEQRGERIRGKGRIEGRGKKERKRGGEERGG